MKSTKPKRKKFVAMKTVYGIVVGHLCPDCGTELSESQMFKVPYCGRCRWNFPTEN